MNPIDLSKETGVTIPLGNLIAVVVATAIATTSYFGVQERLRALEHEVETLTTDVGHNREFRILWPRGELGVVPSDARQDLQLKYVHERLEELEAAHQPRRD